MTHVLRSALRARRSGIDRLQHARHRDASRALRAAKPGQAAAWRTHAARTEEIHRLLEEPGPPPSVSLMWSRYVATLREALLPVPPADFLHNPLLLETMLVRGARLRHRELQWLRGRLDDATLQRALEEDPAGDPALVGTDPLTSPTAIHHLFHLERLTAATGVRAGDVGVIVEWGGGFGGFARTVRRSAGGAPPTHVIIDLPLIAALQWTYLSTVLGPDQVELALAPGHRPTLGKLTIVPSHLAFDLDVRADLFVSLWGLSETGAPAQDTVAGLGFYGAEHLLLAFQNDGPDTPHASRVGTLGQQAGGRIEPVGVLSHSSYVLS